MSRFPEPTDPNDWSPMTSRPGEIYTVEGEIRGVGRFMRGLRNDDPRLNHYRRSMRRVGLAIAAVGLVVAAILIAVTAIFGS